MNFLADENVDRHIADCLRLMGHNIEYVAEKDAGISDDEVLKMANKKNALLLTADKAYFTKIMIENNETNHIDRKTKEGLICALLSESSIKKDWLKPEEDEAWREL